MESEEVPTKRVAIERIAWVVSNNFKEDVGGFCFRRADYEEMIPLFGIEDFKADFENYAKEELGKDLVITVEVGSNVWISWKPAEVVDGR